MTTRSGRVRTRARPVPGKSASSLRIAGGRLKGRRLSVVSGVRPTASRVREALFSIWQSRIDGCHFLDLFAGSGAVGLEAISRGASRVVFVEGSPQALRRLKQSVGEHAPGAATIVQGRLPGGLDRVPDERFDLIFADPPYAFQRIDALLMQAAPRLQVGGQMAFEHSIRFEFAAPKAPWQQLDRRCYGDSCLTFFTLDGVSE